MARQKLDKIAYEEHPVSQDRKLALRKLGYRIVDIRYAPKDQPVEVVRVDAQDDELSYTDDELRQLIEQATGERPHHKTGRAKLVAAYNELNV